MNKKILSLSISLCILVIGIGIAVTYAYFAANFYNVESKSTINVGAANIGVTFTQNNNNIVASGIEPGWNASKYFTVTVSNSTNKTVNYDVKLNVVSNNFSKSSTIGNGSSRLYYTFYRCSAANGTSCSTLKSTTQLTISSGSVKLHSENGLYRGTSYYRLMMKYPDDNVVQSQYGTDGKLLNFSGYITVTSDSKIYE